MESRLQGPDHISQSFSASNINLLGLFCHLCCIHSFIKLANCANFITKLQKGLSYQSRHDLNRMVSFYKGIYTYTFTYIYIQPHQGGPVLLCIIGSFKKRSLNISLSLTYNFIMLLCVLLEISLPCPTFLKAPRHNKYLKYFYQ